MAISQSIKTPAAMENGFGGVDMGKMASAIELLKVSFGIENPPAPEAVFDMSYLPAKEERMLP